MSKANLAKLRLVQDSLARVVTSARKLDYITPLWIICTGCECNNGPCTR